MNLYCGTGVPRYNKKSHFDVLKWLLIFKFY
jgi:hypothetical protein